ncbi:hypothetical protein ACFWWS_36870 [Streptomyces sp. NPDC059083]|uniref:hypothetical protein n=1 Tax=Streptomyces sp. NPDC059083 TaxID=3346721 RepID=UPI00367EF068
MAEVRIVIETGGVETTITGYGDPSYGDPTDGARKALLNAITHANGLYNLGLSIPKDHR